MKALVLATTAAIAMQPFVFAALFFLPMLALGDAATAKEVIGISLFAAVIAAPYVVAVGIPSLLLLRRFNRLSWKSLGAIGFIAAALLLAIYGWSGHPGSSSSGSWYGTHVNFVIDGQKTPYGWLSYAQSILFVGLHGLAAALAFFLVWRSTCYAQSVCRPASGA